MKLRTVLNDISASSQITTQVGEATPEATPEATVEAASETVAENATENVTYEDQEIDPELIAKLISDSESIYGTVLSTGKNLQFMTMEKLLEYDKSSLSETDIKK